MRWQLTRVLHPWWRLTRGMTLGVRGVVAQEGRVLLVRHSYVAGWHLPGGGVERSETVGEALVRELAEEGGIIVEKPGRLHGLFSNDAEFPGDHVAVFVVEDWQRITGWRPGAEIAEAAFFPRDGLPEEATPGTRRRLAEVFDGAAPGEAW